MLKVRKYSLSSNIKVTWITYRIWTSKLFFNQLYFNSSF